MASIASLNLCRSNGVWRCFNRFFRTIIPYYASKQDQATTAYFLNYFQTFFKSNPSTANSFQCRSIIRLSQEHMRCYLQGRSVKDLSCDFIDLERYVFAARMQLKDFSSPQEETEQKTLCARHCEKLLNKWKKLGHPEEAFWRAPDLVDLLMRSFLHKAMHYSAYRHTIEMRGDSSSQDERAGNNKEPCLKIQGTWTPWKNIRAQLLRDDNNRIYSLDANQNKIYWWYFQEGLIPWDKFNWNAPHAFSLLRTPPQSCEVQLVTSHAKKDQWNLSDRYLKGNRHTFIRIVFRQGYSQNTPLSLYKDGEVYSFGFGFDPKDFSKFSPLATLRGRIMIPDYAELETEKEALYVTPFVITDKKAHELMDRIIKRSSEPMDFHFMHANCAASVANLLSEAQIVNLPIKTHLLSAWYAFLVPDLMRDFIEKSRRCFSRLLPSCMYSMMKRIALVVHSIFLGPIFVLLGSCKVNTDPADPSLVRKGIKPHFTSIMDVFNPNKMIFAETKKIAKWQTQQPQTYFERTLRTQGPLS